MNIDNIGEGQITTSEGDPNPPAPQVYFPIVFGAGQENNPPRLVVVSYNTHDGSSNDFEPALLDYIRQVGEDGDSIIGFQEATPDEVRQLITQRGWSCAVSERQQHLCDSNPGSGYELDMGTLIFHEMTPCRGVSRFAVSATVKGPMGDAFTVITTHICHVDSVKEIAFQRLEQIVEDLGGEAVVAADFNTEPEVLGSRQTVRQIACTSGDSACASVGERGPVDNIAIFFTNPNTGQTMGITNGGRGPVTEASDHTPVSGQIIHRVTNESVGTPDTNYPQVYQPIGYPVGP